MSAVKPKVVLAKLPRVAVLPQSWRETWRDGIRDTDSLRDRHKESRRPSQGPMNSWGWGGVRERLVSVWLSTPSKNNPGRPSRWKQ